MTPHNVLVCRLFRSLSTDSVACGKFFAGTKFATCFMLHVDLLFVCFANSVYF